VKVGKEEGRKEGRKEENTLVHLCSCFIVALAKVWLGSF
jgi:hypothetical protein